MRSTWLPKFRKTVWAVFLVSLPVTSFPYFPGGVGGRTEVRPLAVYPLLILLLLVTLPRLFTQSLPRTVIPLGAFTIVVLASSMFAFTRGIDPDIGVSVPARTLRMIATLLLGGAFYLTVAMMPTTGEQLRTSLRWLYIGFMLALAWGSLQAANIFLQIPPFFEFLSEIQAHLSIRRLFQRRVSGMTYEPNWFAEQIVLLLMPWLFAALLSGCTVFSWRWRGFTVEAVLLAWASVVLVFTYSRAGFVLMVVQLILALFLRAPKGIRDSKRWKIYLKRAMQIGLIMALIVVVAFMVGERNNYFSRLWSYWTDEESTGTYLQYIAFSQRFIYWDTAYRIFQRAPLLGVGLGNYTFYFSEWMPNQPLYPNPELLRKLTPVGALSRVVVPKNMFARVLAETGLLGMAVFLAFLIGLLGCALYLYLSSNREQKFWGRAGILGLAMFTGVAFSVDSFAIPNMWIVFGLITASARVFSHADM